MLNFRGFMLRFLSRPRPASQAGWRLGWMLGLAAAALQREGGVEAAPARRLNVASVSRSATAKSAEPAAARSPVEAPSGSAISVPAALAALPTPVGTELTPLWRRPGRRVDYVGLGALLPVGPSWQTLEANSEQRQPLHLGASPREQVLFGQTLPQPRLPLPLKRLAESQLPRLRQRLGVAQAEFEAWPTQNEVGRLTWVVARWRPRGDAPWRWLEQALHGGQPADPDRLKDPSPILPERLEPGQARDRALLLDDFLLARSLYDKPRFSSCIWTNIDGSTVLAAFLPSQELPAQRESLQAASANELGALRCQAMPQPPRFHDHALTFVLRVTARGTVLWPEALEWQPMPTVATSSEPTVDAKVQRPQFPPTFLADYRADVEALSGAAPLRRAAAPGELWLRRKSSADPQHQLEALVQVLEERYRRLGLVVQRQRFTFRGIPQSNLIAILRGRRTTDNRPILLADHIDTALCEDVFARTGERVSSPGADDNASATAALLRAAEVLRPLPREHDIWLVHLTGEEFPADDLGARRFVQELLRRRQDIAALLVLDMIGQPPPRGRQFQIGSGGLFESGAASLQLAQLTRTVAAAAAPELSPLLLLPDDPRNFLYNTDGLIFAEAGFPVVLLNEVMHRYTLDRRGYHDLDDSARHLDFEYAAAIAKVAITTAAVLAQQGVP